MILYQVWTGCQDITLLSFVKKKKVVFQPSKEYAFEYKGTPQGSKWPVVTAMKVRRMLAKACIRYLANIVDTTEKGEATMSDIVIVCKIPDVFPEDLLGLPLDQEIEFEIELFPEITLISKVPYRMAPTEL